MTKAVTFTIMLLMRLLVLAALTGGAVACGGGGGISMPRPIAFAPVPADSAIRWAAGTVPSESREIRFRWQFQDGQGAAGGRGRVRFAGPDSARLDVQGPLGSGRAAAFVRGDTAVWAEPASEIERLLPNYPLFWALLGIVRPPEPGVAVRGHRDAAMVAWQWSRGADTIDYVRTAGARPRLIAEVRQAGKRIGAVETSFAPDGLPATARLIVPSAPARLDITFSSTSTTTTFAPDTWTPPRS